MRVLATIIALNATIGRVASAQWATPPDSIVATHSQVVVGGKTLKYTARAGLLPLFDNDTGELMARMFFVSYTVDRAAGAPARPLTFVWNGGPGSNAGQVACGRVRPQAHQDRRRLPGVGAQHRDRAPRQPGDMAWCQRSRISRSGRHGVQPRDDHRVSRHSVLGSRRYGGGRGIHSRLPQPLQHVELTAVHRGRELRHDAGDGRVRSARAAANASRWSSAHLRWLQRRPTRAGRAESGAAGADVHGGRALPQASRARAASVCRATKP